VSSFRGEHYRYRKSTLPYTRVFLPPQLYDRFRQIFVSDEDLRKFIEKNKGTFDTLPVRIAANIRATRSCVLDARKVDVIVPGKQIYPNYPFFIAPQAGSIAGKVRKKLRELFPAYAVDGRKGTRISTAQAQKIVSLIKTNGTNVWNDRKVPMILSYLGQYSKKGVILKYREAERSPGDNKGLLEQGVLTGAVVTADSLSDRPVLWVFEMRFSDGDELAGWDGSKFFYPTLVVPKKFPLVVFNKS
jgi:hypothetical protein